MRKCARTTPLLNGLSVFPMSVSILFCALKLLKSCLECNCSVSLFYKMLLKRKQLCCHRKKCCYAVSGHFYQRNDVL